jgi:tetratricopeptide (TPR) repeat protein
MLPRSARPVVLLMILLVVIGVPVWGQSWAGRGRLQGTVKDEAGKPIEGAKITLRMGNDRVDPKADGPKSITTDKSGKWSVLGLAGGSWGILIEKEGYMVSEGQVKVNEYAIAQPLNVALKVPPKEVLQQAQEAQKDSPAALAKAALERANGLLTQGKYADARTAYQEGMAKLEDKSLHPAIYRAIADTYYRENKSKEAIEALKQSLEIEEPDDPATLQLIANLLIADNREDEAKQYIAKLPQGTKMDPAAILNLGIKAFNENKMDEAMTHFNRVVTDNPDLAEVYYYRALVYMNQNKNDQAKADLQKLIQLDPNNKFAKDAKEFLKDLK